jgi:hypothetical protein
MAWMSAKTYAAFGAAGVGEAEAQAAALRRLTAEDLWELGVASLGGA